MPVIKSRLDLNLPDCVDHSLTEWCQRYDKLRMDRVHDDDDEALVFALTGHYKDDFGEAHRACIDLGNKKVRDDFVFTQLCDVDSVIGFIFQEFPIQDNAVLEYHLHNNASYCLSDNIHLPGYMNPYTKTLMKHKDIPHGVFATLNNRRTIIRIFFPNAIEEMQGGVLLDDKLLAPFYDRVVRPAAAEIASEHFIRSWPVTYEGEMARAKKANGQPQFSGKPFYGSDLKAMLPRMQELVTRSQDLAAYKDWFWMVEMKGVKATTVHPPPSESTVNEDGTLKDPDSDPRTLAIDTLLSEWEWANFQATDWYLDIATTISVTVPDGRAISVFFRQDAHAEMIRYFTQEPIDRCLRLVGSPNGRDYQFDQTALIQNVGGFRLTLPDREEKDLRYLQAYTTDKTLVYHKQGGSVCLNSSVSKVLHKWDQEKERFFDATAKIYQSASNKDTTSHVAARIESRARIFCYPVVHTEIPQVHLSNWLCWSDTRGFWGFKGRRQSAITHTLQGIKSSHEHIRWANMPEIGSLIVTLVWMSNALANRPASGGTWDIVKDSASVHRVGEADKIEACHPLGYVAVHSLLKGPALLHRFSSLRHLDMPTILKAASDKDGSLTETDLYVALNPAQTQRNPSPLNWNDEPPLVPGRPSQPASSNKKRRINNIATSPAPDVFGEGPGQISIPGLSQGNEKTYSSEEEDTEERDARVLSYEMLSEVLHLVAVQLLAKAPNNNQTRTSYCKLDNKGKRLVTNSIFQSYDKLQDTWHSYQLFHDSGKWNNSVNRLFPTRQEYAEMTTNRLGQPVQPQGLYSMGFWKTWQGILNRAPRGMEEKIVEAMRNHIHNTWCWLPAIEGGKLWNTAKKPTARHFGPPGNAPWIAYNPRFHAS